jgi:hypothetical protein
MKKALLVIALVLFASAAFAQVTGNVFTPGSGTPYTPTNSYTYANPTGASGATDVLGAHNGYGRGCVMCHAPHSGAAGNANGKLDPYSGNAALWGQDVSPLYSATVKFGDSGTYAVTLPAQGTVAAHSANADIMFCLSCHDGSVTKVGMMQNQTVETLPIVGGKAPTLLGMDGTTLGNYLNDHPVGPNADVGCLADSPYNWDCTGGGTSGTGLTPGPNMTLFMKNYPASFWNGKTAPMTLNSLGTTKTAVTCTSCHDQHSMTVWTVAGKSYPTMFFIKGQYTPNQNGNSVAQFCRNCHGGEANEMHGLTDVPTI